MHDFHYRGNRLFAEELPVEQAVKKVGTPFYLYSYKTITDHFLKLRRAFREIDPLICFSMKANGNLAVLKALVREGAGLDIVSGGELFRALRAGCRPEKIVYAGVGKTEEEIEEAISRGILLFNVESEAELTAIQKIARRLGRKVNVSVRLNPEVDPQTHHHIATGKRESKFGVGMEEACRIFKYGRRWRPLYLAGVHVHIGSQITHGGPFVKAFRKVLSFMDTVERFGVPIRFLNLGGGLGIIYKEERPQTADEFAARILPLLEGRKCKVIFEPGRFIVGNGGIFVTRVLYRKKTRARNFVIVDGAMNDLIRPALYNAYHEIWPLQKVNGRRVITSDVVGPICESGDFFAKGRRIPELLEGEVIALLGAGAYGFTMSSNYNARLRVPEVMVKGDRFEIVRGRERLEDLVRGERIPKFLR